MNRQTLVISAAIFTSAIFCGAGFILGIQLGAEQSELLQSTVKATLLVGELRALRGGKYEQLIHTKEMELDQQVLLYARSLKEGHPLLLWPESSSFEHERYLRQVAAYRKEFPAVLPTVVNQGAGVGNEEMREVSELVATTTAEIIRAYGK